MKRLISAIMLGALAAFAQNLVKDSGFEGDEQLSPSLSVNWKQDKKAANWEPCIVDGVSNGTCASIKFDRNRHGEGNVTGAISQIVKCKGGTEYTVKAQLKGNGCRAVVTVFAEDGKAMAVIASDSNTWKPCEGKFTTGEGAAELRLVISCEPTGQSGNAAVDDVAVFTGSEGDADASKAIPPFVAKGENIALGKPYKFSFRPNYGLCADPDDIRQLTDGNFTSGYFWTQKSTVGWNTSNAVSITIDLGSVQPIGGFAYSTGFGKAGVHPAEFVNVYTSDDEKTWYFIGDLYAKSVAERGNPDPDTYVHYKAGSNDMNCKGRYVSFLIKGAPFIFVDELQVFKGDASLLEKPASANRIASQPVLHFFDMQVQQLLGRDLDELASRANKLKAGQRAAFLDDIEEYRANGLGTITVGSIEDCIPIYPLSVGHKGLFAINARYFQARGITRPMLWRNCRWDNMNPMAEPPKAKLEDIEIEMMRGEVRAETVNILNPTNRTRVFKVSVKGLPEGSGIDCREVLGMLTSSHEYSASALKPGDGDSISVEIVPGMSKQIWLSFKRPTLKAGSYKASVTAVSDDVSLSVPLKLTIYDFDFPKAPRLHVGGWDYLQGNGNYYGGKDCVDATIAMMRSIYADSPWGTPEVMPAKPQFDAEGNLTNPDGMDFTMWDGWVKRWSNARIYCAFANHHADFYGEPMGTPRFDRMVIQYYQAWAAHVRKAGMDPRNIVVLIYDEPYSKQMDDIIVAYAKPIHAANAGFQVFEDPCWPKLEQGNPAMYESSDILCPNTPHIQKAEDVGAFKQFYLNYQAKGAKLWLYSCSGPARLLDPAIYHRGQEWLAFELGAEGSFYWALGCGGGIGDSWHAFKQSGVEYSPFMVSPKDGPMDAKQSEGIREGVQDYEYLCMLRDRIAELKKTTKSSSRTKKLAEAEKLLKEAPIRAQKYTRLPGSPEWKEKNGMMWSDSKDRTSMDVEARKVLRMLNELK